MTEDIKIYRQNTEEPPLSEGEKAAREYRRQQENGNLERAHRLGEALYRLFLAMPVQGDYAAQQWVLLSFLVENELEQQVENTLLSQSVQSRFAELLEQQSPERIRSMMREPLPYTPSMRPAAPPAARARSLPSCANSRKTRRSSHWASVWRRNLPPGLPKRLPQPASLRIKAGGSKWNRIFLPKGCAPAV